MKQRIREKQAALSSHRTATSSSTAAASAPVPERPAAPAHQYRERVEINNEGEDASGQALSADELRRRQLREEYEKLRAQAAGSRRAIKILTGEEAEKVRSQLLYICINKIYITYHFRAFFLITAFVSSGERGGLEAAAGHTPGAETAKVIFYYYYMNAV